MRVRLSISNDDTFLPIDMEDRKRVMEIVNSGQDPEYRIDRVKRGLKMEKADSDKFKWKLWQSLHRDVRKWQRSDPLLINSEVAVDTEEVVYSADSATWDRWHYDEESTAEKTQTSSRESEEILHWTNECLFPVDGNLCRNHTQLRTQWVFGVDIVARDTVLSMIDSDL